jgi:ammonia channel protein AmtB
MFQYAFSAASATIVAGTLAERCQMAGMPMQKVEVFVCFVFFNHLTCLVYVDNRTIQPICVIRFCWQGLCTQW